MAEKMKAVVKVTSGPGAEIRMVDVPSPGTRELLVKVQAASICGTDVHIYDWEPSIRHLVTPPRVFGHEFAGEVVGVGKDVTKFEVGDHVSSETHIPCGKCYQCLTGNQHICEDMGMMGFTRDGGFASYAVVPEVSAVRNPDDLSPEIASVQEPFGNAVHSVLIDKIAGDTALVMGCGPIGSACVAIARASGATKVFAVDINDYRLEIAAKMGATRVLNAQREDVVAIVKAETGGRGVDVLLEMSGNEAAISQGLRALRVGGRVSLLGLPPDKITIDLARDVVFKGATLYGIFGRKMFDTWFRTANLIQSGLVDVRPLITHRFPLEQFEEGIRLMKSGNSGKIVLFP